MQYQDVQLLLLHCHISSLSVEKCARKGNQQASLTAEVVTRQDRLVGLVVRRPPREGKIPGSNPGIFFRVESYQ